MIHLNKIKRPTSHLMDRIYSSHFKLKLAKLFFQFRASSFIRSQTIFQIFYCLGDIWRICALSEIITSPPPLWDHIPILAPRDLTELYVLRAGEYLVASLKSPYDSLAVRNKQQLEYSSITLKYAVFLKIHTNLSAVSRRIFFIFSILPDSEFCCRFNPFNSFPNSILACLNCRAAGSSSTCCNLHYRPSHYM